jgi:hypothetical protein
MKITLSKDVRPEDIDEQHMKEMENKLSEFETSNVWTMHNNTVIYKHGSLRAVFFYFADSKTLEMSLYDPKHSNKYRNTNRDISTQEKKSRESDKAKELIKERTKIKKVESETIENTSVRKTEIPKYEMDRKRRTEENNKLKGKNKQQQNQKK